ncbi:MAG UNVERIFIED_CONTAM: hypothetical protein LVQ98_00880 [Rickettsiaceae bacterium]|jgi:chorismate mutase
MINVEDITQNVIDKLQNLDAKISGLLEERLEMRHIIEKLKVENHNLEKRVSSAVSEINEYLKELEQIKAYYVDNHNHN